VVKLLAKEIAYLENGEIDPPTLWSPAQLDVEPMAHTFVGITSSR
jgi:hypothetical protein